MTIPVLSWPPAPTHNVNPPADHYYASALWLCGRHPKLVELVERVPGAVSLEEDGQWFELDALADALAALDAHRDAWQLYKDTTYEPQDEAAWDAWEARGPKHTNAGAAAIGPMSRTEQSRLRLLALFATPPARVRLCVSDIGGFDSEGQELLRDWTRALLAAV